ncbi:hypothetical protein [Acetobacter oryzoeni]|uniref:Uncharacterized protein n=1 Tax=Acetobacter oryzoeni TaxID=2500548 RepID=A0A5B9GIX8_9PROT|nr:hypothetical protein [Acetobacter oryzoeni]MCP1202020.1 hypothetical protein [Acetobacter oryzoeni]QEE85737.1 hypothetical protein EOV40_008455 [Acetobacter oryzoeni]
MLLNFFSYRKIKNDIFLGLSFFLFSYSLCEAQDFSSIYDHPKHLLNLGDVFNQNNINADSIQKFYDDLPDGSVVEIPKYLSWNGYIPKPEPQKRISWIFDDKISGWWPAPAGDGDLSIQYNSGLEVSSRFLKNKHFLYPADFFLWNDDPNFLGPWNYHWQQYSPANFRAISGPVSSGNTSAITASLNSYGQNPSASYDVGLSLNMSKYGQNSNWGLVIDQTDFSAKSPGAFAQWNEYDVWANGSDIQTWDPNYGLPQAGHRSIFFINAHHLGWPDWKPLTPIKVDPLIQGSLPVPKVINTTAPDHQQYIWYAISSGTTGTNPPLFPAPAKIVATLHHSIMKVTKIVSGNINAGDYITGSLPVTPVKINKQIRGIKGKEGLYELENFSGEIDNLQPFYVAPRIYDNDVIWQFGEELNMTVSSGIFFSGGDTYDTILAVDKNNTVSNAIIDSTLATLAKEAAVLRMSKGQSIDFSSNGALDHRNNHTLDYDNGALNYKVSGKTVFSISDNGQIKSQAPATLPLFSRREILVFPFPKKGMEIYDTDDDAIAIYTGKDWKLLSLSKIPS